jgi:23S rRNA (guanosine2251-2'-O)-methyltransferase
VAKTSAGAVEYVPVARIGNVVQTLENLKKQGFWIVGADMDGEKAYYQADLTGPLVVVIGSEGKGLGRLVKEACDFLVRIPMKGQINSLNASVACSLLLYEVLKQREMKEI